LCLPGVNLVDWTSFGYAYKFDTGAINLDYRIQGGLEKIQNSFEIIFLLDGFFSVPGSQELLA
jgi:hypothetical protein